MVSKPIYIGKERTSVDQLVVPYHDRRFLENVLISEGNIASRVERVAKDIFDKYAGKTLYVVAILQGASKFSEDLIGEIDRLNRSREYDGVEIIKKSFKVSSYKNEESAGIRPGNNELEYVTGNHILIVEDIIDKSRTMKYIQKTFKHLNPKSFAVAVLLKKRVQGVQYNADYTCFTIPKKFIVGHGLDFNEYFRALSHIAILNKKGRDKFEI